MLGLETITVTKRSKVLTDGRFVFSDGATFTFRGSIQPVGQKVLERLPEGARLTARWIVYAHQRTAPFELPKEKSEASPHLATTKGTLVPVAVIDYQTHLTGLPHVAYVCAEKGSDEPKP